MRDAEFKNAQAPKKKGGGKSRSLVYRFRGLANAMYDVLLVYILSSLFGSCLFFFFEGALISAAGVCGERCGADTSKTFLFSKIKLESYMYASIQLRFTF